MILVQIPDEALSFSHSVIYFSKTYASDNSPPEQSLIVKQAAFFSFGERISLEGKNQ